MSRFVPAILSTMLTLTPCTMAIAAPVAAPAEPTLSDVEMAKAIANAFSVLGKQEAHIWPGYQFSDVPVIVSMPGKAAYLFHYPKALPSGYTAVSGLPGVAMTSDTSKLPHGLTTRFLLDGVTCLTWQCRRPQNPADDVDAVVHELFHLYEQKHRFYWENSEDLTVDSIDDLALAVVEQRWLADALDARSPQASKECVRQFLAVRTERQRRHGPAQTIGENTLEVVEGMANYVEEHFWDQTRSLYATLGWTSRADKAGLIGTNLEKLRRFLLPDDMTRARFYYTGSSMGMVLDRLSPGWKAEVEAGATLTTLLAKAASFDPAKAGAALPNALAGQHYDQQLQLANQQAAEAEASRQRLIDAFRQRTGQRLELHLPKRVRGYNIRYSDEAPWPEGGQLVADDAQIELGDPAASVTIKDMILIQRPDGRVVLTITVPLADVTASINGKAVDLSQSPLDGALNLSTPKVTVKSDMAHIRTDGGRTVIEME